MVAVCDTEAGLLPNLSLIHGHEIVAICTFVVGMQLRTIDLCHTYFEGAIGSTVFRKKRLLIGIAPILEGTKIPVFFQFDI